MAPPTLLAAMAAALVCTSVSAAPVAGDWIAVPVSAATCSPMDYGGKGDGTTDDTAAVQAAINACVSSHGTAVIPVGLTFMTWGLTIKNANVFALRVDGTIRFFNDTARWPAADQFCIQITGSSFVAVHGSGLVDGNGAAWWPNPNSFRPGLLHTSGGTDLLIRDVTFIQSPNHNLQLYTAKFEVRRRQQCAGCPITHSILRFTAADADAAAEPMRKSLLYVHHRW